VEVDEPDVAASRTVPGPDAPQHEAAASADAVVAALYEANVLALSRLAYLMLGDRASAEDVVQEAFCTTSSTAAGTGCAIPPGPFTTSGHRC
jgi:DNA-directed RNA polymerase specialized sigma24 family protein